MVTGRSERTCLLCGRSFTGRTFLCRDCSERLKVEKMTAEEQQRFYSELDKAYPERSNTYGSYNRPDALIEAVKRLPRHVRILEVGSGGGFLGRELADLGFTDIVLTDVTESATLQASIRVPEALVVLADGEHLSFADGAFDVVISSDVIEHLQDPGRHIDEVRRLLTPHGLYFCKTPNRLMAEAFYRLAGLHDSHVWHPSMFSPAELREALEERGFEVRFLSPKHLTNAQLAKLPASRVTKPLARKLPVNKAPLEIRPHLEVIARKV